ncbi:hypothetical protein GGP41_009918 [Bipolaris sorokiniana]|uniref:BTB domain-containing protein n=2 Tax=Cochliobolus sativus TaxID=45130 RepID=A0A8H6DUH0_COCSA|nr:uncharacterized protein COCSADRAFT_183905 [Bipolaris sorokiniana ND90Pr]EMD60989.1 hypothetical protein COCSADRAFT_183905 [Bipolaris sorokiniana ND90Pr]KAF5848821.1 hypothetical protein GGP41_009918 [Bipolaris sorokiniana]
MDDLSFLDMSDQGNATLKAVLAVGEVRLISCRICPYMFLDRCPLLYHAFEYGLNGCLQASIEVPSANGLISLLRYCYTGSYLPPTADDGPPLLLPHVEVYKMAEDFDVPELQLLAHGNFSCQIEFACCVPFPPQDLLETIRFVYRHYSRNLARRQHDLVGTLLNYIISRFMYYNLGEDADFIELAADIPEFCQDLCSTNMERNFEDDCAFHIIRLCLDTLCAQSCIRPIPTASKDLLSETICEEDTIISGESESEDMSLVVPALACGTNEREDTRNMMNSFTTTLVHRPKIPQPDAMEAVETLSSDEDEDYTVVSLSGLHTPTTSDELMSSPELIPTPIVDILAATGTEYTSDDEWTIVR